MTTLSLLTLSDMATRVIDRTPGSDYDGPAKAFIQVSGRADGSPFIASVTIVDDALLAGCAADVESDARWALEPFLGVLTAEQVAQIVEEVTDAARRIA